MKLLAARGFPAHSYQQARATAPPWGRVTPASWKQRGIQQQQSRDRPRLVRDDRPVLGTIREIPAN